MFFREELRLQNAASVVPAMATQTSVDYFREEPVRLSHYTMIMEDCIFTLEKR